MIRQIEILPTSGTPKAVQALAEVTLDSGLLLTWAIVRGNAGVVFVAPATFQWNGRWRRAFSVPTPMFEAISRAVLAAWAESTAQDAPQSTIGTMARG